jgi:hypothetical protein
MLQGPEKGLIPRFTVLAVFLFIEMAKQRHAKY